MEGILDADFTEENEPYTLYSNFYTLEAVRSAMQRLQEAGIPYRLQKQRLLIDKAIIGDPARPDYALWVPRRDLQRAESLYHPATDPVVAAHTLPPDHFLHQFSDEELVEVLAKADTWNPDTVRQALLLLQQRGRSVSDEDLAILENRRSRELAAGRPATLPYLLGAYLCATIGSFLGLLICPVLAAAMGWSYYRLKDRGPQGKQHFRYNRSTRLQGLLLIALAVICFTLGAWQRRI